MKKEYFVSLIVPLENDGSILDHFLAKVEKIMDPLYENYEVILVNNASQDNTNDIISDLLRRYKCIRYFELTRVHHTETVIAAGFQTAIGDVVVSLSPQTDDPALIPRIIQETRKKGGIVSGVHQNFQKIPLHFKIGKNLFHAYCKNILKFPLVRNTTHLHGMDRTTLNAFLKLKEENRYLRFFYLYTGIPTQAFIYEPKLKNLKKLSGSFIEESRLAARMILANSLHPLRFMTFLGLLASFFNLIYIGYILYIYFSGHSVIEGWTTISLQISGLFVFLFLILTLLSEYLGQILKMTKNTPTYYTTEEKNSSVFISDATRRNTTNQTE